MAFVRSLFLARLGRAFGLCLGAALVASSAGCTNFQTIPTEHWFEGRWFGGEVPVNHVLSHWENRVIVAQDSINHGAALPGLVGRLYLLNEDSQSNVDAHGSVVVQVHDVTNVQPNTQPPKLVECRFDPVSLKSLKKKDRLGEGYTLFVPWEQYRPEVKQVQLQLCYVPRHGAPRYSEPQLLSLQPQDQARPLITHRQEVPALQHLEALRAQQAAPAAVMPERSKETAPVVAPAPVAPPPPQAQGGPLPPAGFPLHSTPAPVPQSRGLQIMPIGPAPGSPQN